MLQKIKAFIRSASRATRRENCLPINAPFLEGLASPEKLKRMQPDLAEKNIRQWENYRIAISRTKDKRLQSALIRVHLCSFLKLITSWKANTHYSWCVRDEWVSISDKSNEEINSVVNSLSDK